MVQELSLIKEQLFDAPSEVKSAFNNVIKYFESKDRNSYYIYWILNDSFTGKGPYYELNRKPMKDGYKPGDMIKKKSGRIYRIIAGPFKSEDESWDYLHNKRKQYPSFPYPYNGPSLSSLSNFKFLK